MHDRKHVLSIAMIVGVVLSLAAPTAAQGGPPPPATNILYGFITSSRTLTYTTPGPDYLVVGDVVVDAGATLTIEPGVRVVFSANRDTLQGGTWSSLSELQINGSLVANATGGDSIKFVSSQGGLDQWGGIEISAGGAGTLAKCAIQGAAQAITNNGILTITNVSMFGDGNGIVSTGQMSLSDVHIDGFGTGITLPWGTGTILRATVSGSTDGIVANGFEGSIRESVLRGRATNVGTGLSLGASASTLPSDSTDVRPTIISGFATGVSLRGSGTARNLLVYDNTTGVVSTESSAQVLYCTVVGNSGDGIRLWYDSHIYNTISAMNSGRGMYNTYYSSGAGYVNYTDSWSNSNNYERYVLGARAVAFNPFFVDPGSRDYHLAAGSIFKTFGPWGAEIGVYGPGPGSPTPSQSTSWGRIKANYR